MKIERITQEEAGDGRELVVVVLDKEPSKGSHPSWILTYHIHKYGPHVLLQLLSSVSEDTKEPVKLSPQEMERVFGYVCQHIEENAWAY